MQRAPTVEHGGGVSVRGLHAESLEVGLPVCAEGLERYLHLYWVAVAPSNRADVTGSVSDPQHIDNPGVCSGLQAHLVVERPNVVATRGFTSVRAARDHSCRVFQSPVPAYERLSIAVVAERGTVRGEELSCGREPGPSNDGVASLVIARAQYVLAPVEVVHVTGGVYKAQLHVAEDLDRLGAMGVVGQPEHPQLCRARVIGWRGRHEVQDLGPGALSFGGDLRVPRAVTALVTVQRGPHRLPGRAPVLTGVLSAEVDIAAGLVWRERVVAVAAHPAVTRVAVKGEATGGVGDDASVTPLSQVVDPGRRRVRAGDHVLPGTGVVVAVGISGQGGSTDGIVGLGCVGIHAH